MPKGSSDDDDDRSDDEDEREGEGSDDDSDSSSAETDERCGELLAQLQQGSLTYGAALELIGLLKARADLPGVRQAREALAAAYPLPEAVWLEWIEDEIGDRPYGVDLIVPAKYAGDGDGGYTMDDIAQLIPAEHREFIDDILDLMMTWYQDAGVPGG